MGVSEGGLPPRKESEVVAGEQPQPVLAVYRLGGSGFIVNYAGVPYAKESAETAADLVRQLLLVGQGAAPRQQGVQVQGGPVGGPIPVSGTEYDGEIDKQRRNLMRLVTARINGGIDDREFSEKAREFCPQIDLSVCLDALDRGFMNEPMPWAGGEEAPHAVSVMMDDLSEEVDRPRQSSGSKLGDPLAGMIDYGPGNVASMIQDYVVDDFTGEALVDGR